MLSPPPPLTKLPHKGDLMWLLTLWCHQHLCSSPKNSHFLSIRMLTGWLPITSYEVPWVMWILLPLLKVTNVCPWAVKISTCIWYVLRRHLITPTSQKLGICAAGIWAPCAGRRWLDRVVHVVQGPQAGWANQILFLRNLNWWAKLQFPSVVGTALCARRIKVGDRGGKRQREEMKEERERTYSVRQEILSDETVSLWIARDAAGNLNSWLSRSQAPSRRTGCASCLVLLRNSPYQTNLQGSVLTT